MADAEIRFRAVLQDDASRGIDALDNKVQASGTKAARANQLIGQSAARAAEQVRTSASRMAQSFAGFANNVSGGRLEKTFQGWKRGLQDFHSGFKDASAAASSFTGRMAVHGARTREIWDKAAAPLKTFGGHARNAASAVGGAFKTMGGAISSAASSGQQIGLRLKEGIVKRVDEAKAQVGERLKDIGKGAALAVGVGVGAVVVNAVKNAAELEQTMGAMDAVFKENAGQMIQWSLTAAETTGLSKVEYQSLATVLGASLKNGGMALDEVGGKTNELITIGADLSSMFGGTTKEAVEAMTAALRGESDPIERYGVSLTAAKVEAEALAMGAEKVNGELTTQAKQAAILSLVTKQTADAQGNFARETGTFSGALQIFKAQWANLVTQWASNVIPMLSTLVVWVSNKIIPALSNASNGIGAFFNAVRFGSDGDWGVLEGFDLKMQNIGIAIHNAGVKFSELWGKAQPFFDWIGRHKDVFGTLAVGIGIAAAAMGTLTAVTWLLNAALVIAFSPVVLIGVFIGAVILAYNKIGWFKDGVNSAWETIKVGASAVGTAIAWVWNFVVSTAQAAWRNVTTNVTSAIDGIKSAWNGVTTFFSNLWLAVTTATRVAWEGIKNVLTSVATWFANTGRAAWDGAVRAVGAVFTWLKDTIVTPVWNGIRLAIAVAIGAAQTVLQLFGAMVRNVLAPAFTWFQTAVITPVFNTVRTIITTAVNYIRNSVFNPLITFIRVTLNAAWVFLRTAVTTVWTAIRTASSAAWSFLQGSVFQPIINFIRGVLTSAWNYIRDTILARWTAIRTASSQAWNFLRDSVFNPVINFIRGALTSAWNFIRDTILARWTAIRTASTQAWNFLRDSVFQPVINFIRGVFTSAWNYIRDTIQARWQTIRTLSSQAWNFLRDSVFNPIINFLRTNVTNAWNYVRDMITNAWNAVRDRVRNGYSSMKSGALDPLVKFVRETIPNAFASARDAIGKAWDGIKKKVIDPVNEVIRVIKNVLIGNINNVLKEFGMSPINVGFNAPSGGGFRDGGYTGPGHPGAPAGVVHRDEHVIKSPARRSVEDRFPGFLDDMNTRGAAAVSGRFNNPANMAVGAAVYGGKASFGNPLQHAVFASGALKVSGSAPGYDLAGAIRMVDNATRVKVSAGSGGGNTVSVTAANYPDWWGGYYSGNSIRLNNRIAGNMNPAAKRVMLAHEIGHALGLPHSDPGPKSMMSYANMYQHNSVTSADVAALSAIYGGTGFASGGGGIDVLAMLAKGVTSIFDGLFKATNVGARIAGGGGRLLMKKAGEWASKLGMARGGIIPGYAPGYDRVPIMASPGESVLTPQLTRALGPRNITAANAASSGNRAGGGRAVSMLGQGGGGGINVNVELSVTIEGNADDDAIARLEADLEPMIYRVIEDATRRGY